MDGLVDEKAITGGDFNMRLNFTDALTAAASLGRWEAADGSGGWRPHPWIDLRTEWRGGSGAIRVGVAVPLGRAGKAPPWRGLGVAAAAARAPDPFRPVENVQRIQVATRERTADPARAADRPRVRFLQDAARTGAEVALEVALSAPAPRDLRLTIRLVPGRGPNPAAPGEDYRDEPIPIAVPRGAASARTTVRLLTNATMENARSLGATVAFAS